MGSRHESPEDEVRKNPTADPEARVETPGDEEAG